MERWFKQRKLCESEFAYCDNDPVNHVDITGHSAAGCFGYTLLAIFWSLPYTVNAFLFFEVIINWIFYYIITFAWLWDKTHEWGGSYSDRLSTWSWNIIGGFSGKMVVGGGAFTQGNIIFYNSDFYKNLDDAIKRVRPESYPDVILTDKEGCQEHELRHVAQFSWFGPFFMPWILLIGFLFYYTIFALFEPSSFVDRWRSVWNHFKNHLWELAFIPILPGAYWWAAIGKGSTVESYFEEDAGKHSGWFGNGTTRTECTCSSCNHTDNTQDGQPCSTKTCPTCGTALI